MSELLETYLEAHPDGVDAATIATEVMLLRGPRAMVERIAEAALRSTPGVVRDDTGRFRWQAAPAAPAAPPGSGVRDSGDRDSGDRDPGDRDQAPPLSAPPLSAPPLSAAPTSPPCRGGVGPHLARSGATPAPVPADGPAVGERALALVARVTGRDPSTDRLLEVAAVELVDGVPTGRSLEVFARPPRDPAQAAQLRASVDERTWASMSRRGLPLDEILTELAPLADGARLVCLGSDRGARFVASALARGGFAPGVETLSTGPVIVLWQVLCAAGLVDGRARLDRAAAALGVEAPAVTASASTLTSCLTAMIVAAGERGLELEPPAALDVFDFSKVAFDRARLDALPDAPGIYRFLDRHGRVLYVGKARRLRRRVASYFAHRSERRRRHDRLVEQLWDLEVEETGSELGALLAELREIRRHRPPINVQRGVEQGARLEGSHVLFLPGVETDAVDLLLVRDGRLVGRAHTDRRASNMAGLRRELLRAFYTALPPAETDAAETALVARWLRDARSASGSTLDLDAAQHLDDAARLVHGYVTDPDLFEARVVHR